MVFHYRPWSGGDVIEDEMIVQANTTSFDNYHTAHSHFSGRQSGAVPNSQNVSYTSPGYISMSGLPSLRPGTVRSFTFAELKAVTRNFSQSSKIGEGGYGIVHKGVVKSLENPSEEISVAVKRGKRGQQGYRQWVTEVNVLGEVEHPNLVKLVGYCAEDYENESHCLLVYEYMPNGSLDDHLSAKSNAPLPWRRRLKIAQDAATGLVYLHEGNKIIFRDFKPSNILLDNQWNAKLSDFGFARIGPQDGQTHVSTKVVGTKGYAAPEYAQTGRLTFKSDVWSYGIFLEELITGQRPRTQNNYKNSHGLLRWMKCCCCVGKSELIADPRLEGQYSPRSMEKLAFIAKKCLAREPKLRPKMSEVLGLVNEAIALEDSHLLNADQT